MPVMTETRPRSAATQRTCTCSREVDDGYLCHDCTTTTRDHLHTIAHLSRGLDEKRARFGAIIYTHGRSRSADTPIPFDPRVTRVSRPIRQHLRETCAYVFDHRPAAATRVVVSPESIGAMAVWLTSHLPWLRTDPTGPATADRIRRDAEHLAALFDRPPDQLYLGTCKTALPDGTTCPEALYADASTVIRAGRTDLAADSAHTYCRCGAAHEVEPRRAELLHGLTIYQATLPELVSLRPLIGMDGTSRAMLARYTQHGLLPSVGERLERNSRGEWRRTPTYRIGDVNRAVELWKQRSSRKS